MMLILVLLLVGFLDGVGGFMYFGKVGVGIDFMVFVDLVWLLALFVSEILLFSDFVFVVDVCGMCWVWLGLCIEVVYFGYGCGGWLC